MRSALIFAVLATAVAAQRHNEHDTCDQLQFKVCAGQLADFWKVDLAEAFTNPRTFGDIVKGLLKPPYVLNNYVNMCNGLSLMYQCLGQHNIRRCLGPIGLVGSGMPPSEAYVFDGMLREFAFQCGAGFYANAADANFTSCTQSTIKNYNDQLTAVYRTFELNVRHDANNACTYQGQLLSGVGSIFQLGPCRTIHQMRANWWGCEGAQQFSDTQFPHCKHVNKCNPTNIGDYSDITRQKEDGSYEFLLPATWEEKADGSVYLAPARWI